MQRCRLGLASPKTFICDEETYRAREYTICSDQTLRPPALRVGFSGGSVVTNLPDDAGDVVPSLGSKDPLEEKMASHPGFLPRTPCGQRSLAGDSSWGHKELDS